MCTRSNSDELKQVWACYNINRFMTDTLNAELHKTCCNEKLVKRKWSKLFETKENCRWIKEKLRNCKTLFCKIKRNALKNILDYKIVHDSNPMIIETYWKHNGDGLRYLIRLVSKQVEDYNLLINIDRKSSKLKLIHDNSFSNIYHRLIAEMIETRTNGKKSSIRIFHDDKVYVLEEYCIASKYCWFSLK